MSEALVIRNMPWAMQALRDGANSRQAIKIRLDAWANALTGLNMEGRDKTTATLPYMDAILSPQMLEVLYHCSDIAARCVSALPDEAFKRPYKIVSKAALKRAKVLPSVSLGGDEAEADKQDPQRADAKREQDLKAIDEETSGDEQEQCEILEKDLTLAGARKKQHEAMTWGRLYGLGAILTGANDGLPEWMPLERDRVTAVDYLTVLDKRDLYPMRWYNLPTAPKYGEIALFQMQPTGVFMGAGYESRNVPPMLIVHESRLLQFGGELTSKRERLRNQGGDYSILQKCFRALQLVDNNWQSASVLLADAAQGVYKIKGLIDMLATDPDLMTTRMALVDQLKSVVRGIVLDADGEEYERKGTPLTGISDLLDQTWTRLGAAARMPKTILMGTSTSGLNNTGEHDMRWWYDSVACVQEQDVKPAAEYHVGLFAAARGFDPEAFTIVFPPLWKLSETEIADVHLKQAQADASNINAGIVTPEEVAISRFGGGEYSLDTMINVDARKRVLDLGLKTIAAQAELDLKNAKNPPKPGEPGGPPAAKGAPPVKPAPKNE